MSNFFSFFFVIVLICIGTSHCDPEVKFQPTSIDVTVGDKTTVHVSLLPSPNRTYPVTIEFLYDNETEPNKFYIEKLPNIQFNKTFTNETEVIDIIVTGRHEGHLVVTAKSAEVNISISDTFLLIDVSRSKILGIFIQIVGWIYFAAWSISFYPQIILNFQRRSVIGLNFDFLALNMLGHSCYTVFNVALYFSKDVQDQYFAKHAHGVLPVLLNDVSDRRKSLVPEVFLDSLLGHFQLSCGFCVFSNHFSMFLL